MKTYSVFILHIKLLFQTLSLALALVLLPGSAAAASWWNNSWSYMVPVNIPTGASVNSTIVVNVDFAALLTQMGVSGTLDVNSPRVVRADNATLSTDQEFTDAVYNGATDAVGNGRGEVRFILEDGGPTTYYLYFDITANGPKPPDPQMPINGNFERGSTGTATPAAWTSSSATDPSMDTQVRPAETVAVDDSADGAWPSPVNTDGNPDTGLYSYLMGYRTSYDNGGTAILTKTFTVPSTNPGSFNIRIKPEGWDSATSGNINYYDFIRVRLFKTGTQSVLLDIAGPQLNNYASCPFSPNYSPVIDFNQKNFKSKNFNDGMASYFQPGYGYYNDWDNGDEYYTNGVSDHVLGMSATYNGSQQPWTLCSASLNLKQLLGQTVTLEIRTDNTYMFNSWFLIDDVEWSVVDATLGTPLSNFINPGSFNAYDSTTAAGAVTGYITTKIAGSPFNLDLVALNLARTAILTTFTGTVRVDLLDSSSGGPVDSNGCNGAWPVIQTLAPGPTFIAANNGRLTASFTENNAWPNARVRISYPATGTPTAIGCSNDNFAIRPYTFAVSVSDNNWATPGTARTLTNTSASGGIVHKAGQPFTITATAYNAAGAVTSNYAGNPTAALTACVQPATGCTLGTLLATAGSGGWSASSGTVTSNSASYSDAGAFTMQLVDTGFASVDAADGSTPAQRTIASANYSAGRFVPDHFDLAANNTPLFSTFNTTDSRCSSGSLPIRSFTYIGQPFSYLTPPQALIYARNASGATTVNYSNALWHNPIPLASYANTGNTNALDTSLTTAPVVSANNNGTGTATVNTADQIAYVRNLAAPQPPFPADISLSMSVSDSSEAAVTGNGVINTTTSAVFNGAGGGIAFDSGNLFRYGRLSLNNASGAETLNLPVPLQAQYWNGANFIVNAADNCTRLNASSIAMGNYTKNLTPCATALSLGSPLINGIGNLKLLAPGANRNGSVDLTVNLQAAAPPAGSLTCLTTGTTQSPVTAAGLSYLQGKWSGTNYNVDPVVRATFGVYKNANEFIFMREMY
ncbi:MAG TPA: DUF6701 domain-containing protein [Burkholderiales bacterium]|nr:DUF6701 domain-containing protein [Burkholderiales bacterium]